MKLCSCRCKALLDRCISLFFTCSDPEYIAIVMEKERGREGREGREGAREGRDRGGRGRGCEKSRLGKSGSGGIEREGRERRRQ